MSVATVVMVSGPISVRRLQKTRQILPKITSVSGMVATDV